MQLVGFSGYARAGKDTAAEVLASEGWVRIAFADKLRQVLYQLNPLVQVHNGVHVIEVAEREDPVDYKIWEEPVYVQDVIDDCGWDGYKETQYGTEIRRLLQRLGTEAGRQTLWDSIWVDAALGNLDPDGRYAVTDCRFPNEAQAIIDKGGKMIRISRPGVGPANSHPSETSLDNWNFDGHIINDGTLEDLKDRLTRVLRSFG